MCDSFRNWPRWTVYNPQSIRWFWGGSDLYEILEIFLLTQTHNKKRRHSRYQNLKQNEHPRPLTRRLQYTRRRRQRIILVSVRRSAFHEHDGNHNDRDDTSNRYTDHPHGKVIITRGARRRRGGIAWGAVAGEGLFCTLTRRGKGHWAIIRADCLSHRTCERGYVEGLPKQVSG